MTSPPPKQIHLKHHARGNIAWKSTLKDARPEDFMILPIDLRSAVHGAANAQGVPVKVRMLESGKEFIATFVTPEDRTRANIMRDFERLPFNQLKALFDAAKTNGLIP